MRTAGLVAAALIVIGCAELGCARAEPDRSAAARVVAASTPRVVAEHVAYGRWDDAWRLSDGRIELVVVPAIGRVLRLARVGGANLLWEHAAPGATATPRDNLGGGKIWAWPQSAWPKAWPPPIPCTACTVEVIDGPALRLSAPADPVFGVAVVEELRLVPGAAAVEATARFTSSAGAAPAVVPWSVLQLRTPEALLAHRLAATTLPDGWTALRGAPRIHAGPRWLRLETRPAAPVKVGLDADALVAVLGGDALVLVNHDVADGGFAPGEAMQAFAQASDPQEVYVELETIAPPGAATLRTRWSLVPLDAGLALSERLIAAEGAATAGNAPAAPSVRASLPADPRLP